MQDSSETFEKKMLWWWDRHEEKQALNLDTWSIKNGDLPIISNHWSQLSLTFNLWLHLIE